MTKSLGKISYLMNMDDIKSFVKNEKELESLIQNIIIFSKDIQMEFGIEKYTMLIIKREKRKAIKGIELLKQGSIRLFEKQNYKYPGRFDADVNKLPHGTISHTLQRAELAVTVEYSDSISVESKDPESLVP